MNEQIQVGRSEIPTHLYDGYQVHRAALARGLQILALPRQVLLAGRHRTVPSEVSFTHGVPEASTVSAVTYAQDRQLRRALLQRTAVPVPRGATFTWLGVEAAARWSEELGYPVVIKEVVGENPARAIRDVNSREGIMRAFKELRRREPEDRAPGSNPLIAGYATTRLGYMLDDEGNEVAPLRTRFLIEKQVPGRVVRALVCGGRLIAAVLLDVGTGTGYQDVTDGLHEEVAAVLIRAAESIPGLAMATVDVVLDDPRRGVDDQMCLVVELAERPRLHTYITAAAELGDRCGDALLNFQAERAGIDLPPPQSQVSTQALIEGLRDAEAVAKALPRLATGYEVDLNITARDDVAGELTTTCAGSPAAVALLMELLLSGDLLADRAASVEYTIRSNDE